LRYDPINDPFGPEINGFEAGVNFDDGITKQYVGYGYATGGGSTQDKCPGYLNVRNKPKGCYMTISHVLSFDNQTVYYLANHSDLEWVLSNITSMQTLQGAVAVTGSGYPFLFGRIKFKEFYQLGKAHNGNIGYRFHIHDQNHSLSYDTGFEIVRCKPLTTTTSTTTTTTTTTWGELKYLS
jgi:hypothetical protein